MKENNNNDGFVRADQIDLKSLDEQLERHLNRAWTMEKNKKKQPDFEDSATAASAASAVTLPSKATATSKRERQEWEIDPSKLLIKGILARGTFGTVHRGVYDGIDVAGQSSLTLSLQRIPLCFYINLLKFNFWVSPSFYIIHFLF